MSDNWIYVISRDPSFVPPKESIAGAERFLARLAPAADEIFNEMSEEMKFRDCGSNLESIHCPQCSIELPTRCWAERMDEDHLEGGFKLKPIQLPCGHVAGSLNELRYDFDQGFSRFLLGAMNPNVALLATEQIAHFEMLLGCPVKVIYRHI
jgi:hypothetical protein